MLRRNALTAFSVIVAIAGAAVTYMRQESDPRYGLPPLKPEMAAVYEYYKLAFLPDGYPARKMDHGLVAHPIYGVYVIQDYLDQYAETKDPKFVEGAKKVADAAIARMQPIKDGLAFYYTPEMRFTSIPGTYYSGLTQSYYVRYFGELWKVTKDPKYLEAANKSLNSLVVPVSDGGVLRRHGEGVVIEEWPNPVMPDFTLNGWTSAVLAVQQFYNDTGSPVAKELVQKSLVALDSLLPLYDVPDLANSRYRLTGQAWTRIKIDGTTAKLVSGNIEVPGTGTFPYSFGKNNLWVNYVRPSKGDKQFMLNSNLNYVSYPEMNKLNVTIEAAAPGKAIFDIEIGEYSPLSAGPVNGRWVSLGEFDLKAGKNDISVSIPWEQAQVVIYPTNFLKKIGGKNHNSYHPIHIANLRRLSKLSGDRKLADYADKWEAYMKKWPSMPVYAESGAVLIKREQ